MRLAVVVFAAVAVPVIASASSEVSVTLSDGGTHVVHGQSDIYTLQVTNAGPNAATNAQVTIDFPAQVTFVSYTCTEVTSGAACGGTFGSTGVSLTTTIAAGETFDIDATVTVNGDAIGPITVSGSATGDYGDSNSSDDQASDQDAVFASADVSVHLTTDTTLPESSAFANTIDITSSGPDAPTMTFDAVVTGGGATVSTFESAFWTCSASDATHFSCTGTPPVDPEGSTQVIVHGMTAEGDESFALAVAVDESTIVDPTPNDASTTSIPTSVFAVNDAPIITAPVSISIVFNGTATFAGADAIMVTDPDAGSDGIQIRLETAHGSFSLGNTANLSFTNGSGTSDTLAIFSGAQADVTAAFAGAVFTPVQNFHDTATLTIVANDLGHNGNGGPQEARATISILAGAGDSDHDGLSDDQEITYGTDAYDDDTDDDGIIDGNEDIDRNITVDPGETDPFNPDSDGDGLLDGIEVALNAPQGHDTDRGRFTADADISSHTDPLNADTDGGGKGDGIEDANRDGAVQPGETNPNDPNDDMATSGDGGDNGGDDGSTGIAPSNGKGCAAVGASPFVLLGLLAARRRRSLDQ